MRNTTSQSAQPRLCAHQGLRATCPENTLPAFGAALALGVHEIEFDLWMSRDGVPVVYHDPTVDRTTNGSGRIAEMDWSEIRELDAGLQRGPGWRGVRVPRFEELVEFVDGRCGLNIHIKEPGPDGRLVKLVCDMIRERGLMQLGYVAGEEDVLQVAKDYAPDVSRACLAQQKDPARQLEVALEFDCARAQFSRDTVTEDDARRAHDAGIVCNLFWSDEPDDAWGYVQRGIDVILTNAANLLIDGGFPVTSRPHAS